MLVVVVTSFIPLLRGVGSCHVARVTSCLNVLIPLKVSVKLLKLDNDFSPMRPSFPSNLVESQYTVDAYCYQ